METKEYKISKALKISILAVLIPVLSAFIAWCSGYNFDERGSEVAWWVFCTLYVTFNACMFAYI